MNITSLFRTQQYKLYISKLWTIASKVQWVCQYFYHSLLNDHFWKGYFGSWDVNWWPLCLWRGDHCVDVVCPSLSMTKISHGGLDAVFPAVLINPMRVQKALSHSVHWWVSWAGVKEIALDLHSSRFLWAPAILFCSKRTVPLLTFLRQAGRSRTRVSQVSTSIISKLFTVQRLRQKWIFLCLTGMLWGSM